MGEVEAFSLPGLKCYFASADHYPAHFEVLRRGHWLIRVYFLRTSNTNGLVFAYKKAPRRSKVSRADEEALFAMVMKHKRRLRREWNAKVQCAVEHNELAERATKRDSAIANQIQATREDYAENQHE